MLLQVRGQRSKVLVCASELGSVFQIEALKLFTQEELVSWFLQHRGSSGRKLSVHVSSCDEDKDIFISGHFSVQFAFSLWTQTNKQTAVPSCKTYFA